MFTPNEEDEVLSGIASQISDQPILDQYTIRSSDGLIWEGNKVLSGIEMYRTGQINISTFPYPFMQYGVKLWLPTDYFSEDVITIILLNSFKYTFENQVLVPYTGSLYHCSCCLVHDQKIRERRFLLNAPGEGYPLVTDREDALTHTKNFKTAPIGTDMNQYNIKWLPLGFRRELYRNYGGLYHFSKTTGQTSRRRSTSLVRSPNLLPI